MPGRRIIFIIAGLILFCFGLYKFLDGVGAIGGVGSSSSPTYVTRGEDINEQWLIGTWTPDAGARCATWIRFNADHTLTDESGGTGTWRLYASGQPTGNLTLTIGNLPPRTGYASRSGQDMLGLSGPRYYRRAAC